MIVLGIASEHNASAALVIDGVLVGLVQEERLSRLKNQQCFPRRAIQELIADHLGGDTSRIQRVVWGGKESDPIYTALDRFVNFDVADHVQEQHDFWKPYFYGGVPEPTAAYWLEQLRTGKQNPDHGFDLSWLPCGDATTRFCEVERPAAIRRLLGFDVPVTAIDHHTCHAAYAYYGAPIPEPKALVLTADAWGDGCNWSVSVVDEQGHIKRLAAGPDHRVARLYKWVTLILGLRPNRDEYKVMGLAPFGADRPRAGQVTAILHAACTFEGSTFLSREPLRDSYFALRDRLEGYRFDEVAAGLQRWASEVTCAWARYWIQQTGRHGVCFSGGLSHNVKLNGDLLTMPEVEWLSVPASGGDESLSAGAVWAWTMEQGQPIEPMRHPYLGHDAAVDAIPTGYTVNQTTPQAVAELVADGKILGRCVGRAEFGARALGNRSILADPRSLTHARTINRRIKQRDFWMPSAPSTLDGHPKLTTNWMTVSTDGDGLAATTHPADGSMRPHWIQANPEYAELVEAFAKQTGVRSILNTSLNVHGEPIAYTLHDAIQVLNTASLDGIVMSDNRLLTRNLTSPF